MQMEIKLDFTLGSRLTIGDAARLVNNLTGIVMDRHNDFKCGYQLSVDRVSYKHST